MPTPKRFTARQSSKTGSHFYVPVSTAGSTQNSPSHSPTRTNTTTSGNNTTTTGGTTATTTSSDSEDIDERTEVEKTLFDLVAKGVVKDVTDYLKANSNDIDINKKDIEGLSILHHAVINENEELVDALLTNNNIDVYDALLEAIKKDNMPIVLKIWKWKEILRSRAKAFLNSFPISKNVMSKVDPEYYGSDITPLLMAAMHGHYELIEFFYNNNNRTPLDKVHYPNCTCPICHGQVSANLEKSNGRIHLLKGLTNPTYLAFMAGTDKNFDPILQSFNLIGDIQVCIQQEPEFKAEYEEILAKIKMFPVELLSLCRNMEESKILFRKKDEFTGAIRNPFPRLMLALELKQKEFVAQSNAQDVLYQEWIGEEPWVTTSMSQKMLKLATITLIMPLYPFLSIFALCCPCPCFKFVTAPINRFRSSVWYYMVFLFTLHCMNTQYKSKSYIAPPAHYLPWLVGVFVIAHFATFLRHSFYTSLANFYSSGWNIFELINTLIFFVTFALWVKLEQNQATLGTVLINGKPRFMERNWLDEDDPLLLSEATAAIASTMAGLRLLKFLILHNILGTMQVALGRMVKQIVSFSVFLAIIAGSFALGLTFLHRPYKQKGKFNSMDEFERHLETLAWSLFTLSGADAVDLPHLDSKAPDRANLFPESVGKIIYVSHHIVCNTFLLNMLTGVFSTTYSKTQENFNVEWKYERARMWVYYIQDSVIGGPLNLIPNGLFLFNICHWIRAILGKSRINESGNCCQKEEGQTEAETKDENHKYALLIRRLLQRYFCSMTLTKSDNAPVADDINNVHKHVQELKQLTTMSLDYTSNPNSGTSIAQQSDAAMTPPPPVSSVGGNKTPIDPNNTPVLPTPPNVPVSALARSAPSKRSALSVLVKPQSRKNAKSKTP